MYRLFSLPLWVPGDKDDDHHSLSFMQQTFLSAYYVPSVALGSWEMMIVKKQIQSLSHGSVVCWHIWELGVMQTHFFHLSWSNRSSPEPEQCSELLTAVSLFVLRCLADTINSQKGSSREFTVHCHIWEAGLSWGSLLGARGNMGLLSDLFKSLKFSGSSSCLWASLPFLCL